MADETPATNQPEGPGTNPPPEQPPAPPETEYRAGRPFVFTDSAKLALAIQNYFSKCDAHTELRQVVSGHNAKGDAIIETRQELTDQEPYTVTGLARHLGVDRRTLLNYRQYSHYSSDIDEATKQDLIRTIADAYQHVEEYNEKGLHKPGLANGIKFNLVNNFDWQDKTISEARAPKDDLDDLDDDPAADRQDVAAAAAAELTTAEPTAAAAGSESADEPGSTPPQ